jgi:hypothetical protein
MTPTATHTTGTAGERSATMAARQILTVNLSDTVGQASAIAANGGPVFTIKVTSPARELPPTKAGVPQDVPGFGRVTSGPVKGYEVLYTIRSVV